MAIEKFEDIKGWQQARILVKMVYQLTDEGKFARDFGLRDQIRRAAVSVMANIAEGFDCDSTIEFARFLGIARRSAVEVQPLLYAALDVGYITPEEPLRTGWRCESLNQFLQKRHAQAPLTHLALRTSARISHLARFS